MKKNTCEDLLAKFPTPVTTRFEFTDSCRMPGISEKRLVHLIEKIIPKINTICRHTHGKGDYLHSG